MRQLATGLVTLCAVLVLVLGILHEHAAAKKPDIDKKLRKALHAAGVRPLDAGPAHSDAKIELGRALFFELSYGVAFIYLSFFMLSAL